MRLILLNQPQLLNNPPHTSQVPNRLQILPLDLADHGDFLLSKILNRLEGDVALDENDVGR